MARKGDAVSLAYLHQDEVGYNFHHSLVNLLMCDAAGPGRIMRGGYFGFRSGHELAANRNKVVQQYLADDAHDAPWLLWIDTDMGFQPDALERLLEVADPDTAPIVAALCFGYRDIGIDALNGVTRRPFPTIFRWMEEDGKQAFRSVLSFPPSEIIGVDGTGSAFILIHRSVFDKIGDNWYSTILNPSMPGSYFGEDLSFCIRAGAAQCKIKVHTGVRTNHLKHTFVEDALFWQLAGAKPATSRVDVIVPVLHRPQNVQPLLESLRASTGLASALFVTEPDDLLEQAEVERYGGRWQTTPGTFAEKVNKAYTETTAPWIFLCGDDVRFRPGWLDHALQVADVSGAKVVGTNDLTNPRVVAGTHATHMLIARDYIDEQGASWDGPGVVCHEGYGHWYVDDEIVAAAKQRGVWASAPASIVEHHHPLVEMAPMDAVYEKGLASQDADKALWSHRSMLHGFKATS